MKTLKRNSQDLGQGYSGFPRPEKKNEAVFFRPFVPPVFALVSGIVCGEQYPGLSAWAWILLPVCTFVMIRAIVGKTPLLLPPLLLFFCLGYLSLQHWTAPCFPPDHISRHIGPRYRKICGTVRSAPEMRGDRIKFILDAEMLDEHIPVSGQMLVTGPAEEFILSPGDRVAFSGKIRNISSFRNPGAFDYRRHMAFRSVWCSAYIRKNSLSLIGMNPEYRAVRAVENFRLQTARMIRESGPEDAHSVLLSMLIGYGSSISDELRELFSRAGITHILSVSGLHMSMIALAAYFFFLWTGHRLPPPKQREGIRYHAAFFSLFPVLAYSMISGLSPPAQRSLIMQMVCIGAMLLNRNQDSFNTLTLAALLILIADPPALFSISFQLSFASVAAIIFAFSLNFRPEKKEESVSPFIQYLFSGMKTSFFTIFGIMPITMYYFNQFSLTGLVSNLVFIPLTGFLILPAGLGAVFLSFVSMNAAAHLMHLTTWMLSYLLKLLPFFAHLPFGSLKTFTPTVWEIILYYLVFGAVCLLLSSEKENILRNAAVPVLIIGMIAVAADTLYWLHQRFWHKDLRITVIDVGQGSCALIEFPGGKTMLIDGGGFYDPSAFDVGEAVVAPFLWQKKILSVEMLVLSHPEGDHMNGLFYIARQFAVKQLWTTGAGTDSENYKYFMETVRKANIDVPNFSHMPRSENISGVNVEILWPPADFLQRQEKERWLQKENNTSLTVRLSLGDFSILFPGDIEAMAEEELVKTAGKNLSARILAAPHHGCGTSSSAVFLDQVMPETVIVSCGWQNRFNCPRPEVMDRYKERGCRIFRTDMQGAVSISVKEGENEEIRTYISEPETFSIREENFQQ